MDRIADWERFSKQMELHIKKYAVPQYSSEDKKEDLVNAWNSEECILAIRKYINRFGKNKY